MEPPYDDTSPRAPEEVAELETIIARFERGLGRGDRRKSMTFLPANHPDRRDILVELIGQLEYRHKAGEPVGGPFYLAKYPEDRR